MNNLIAEGTELDQIGNYESYFNEYDRGEVRFYTEYELTPEQVAQLEEDIRSQGVYLTAPIIQDSRIVYIQFEKRIAPLLIIGGIVAAIIGSILGWQIFQTTQMGVPLWAWLVGGAVLVYLFMKSDTGKAATKIAISAGKTYLAKSNPRR